MNCVTVHFSGGLHDTHGDCLTHLGDGLTHLGDGPTHLGDGPTYLEDGLTHLRSAQPMYLLALQAEEVRSLLQVLMCRIK